MGMDKDFDRQVSELEAQDEVLDAQYGNLSRKARNQKLREELGPDWKRQVKDGVVKIIKKVKVDKDTMTTLHGGQNSALLRSLNDPRSFRR